MPVTSYSLQYKQRDLSGGLNTVIAQEPAFISLFKPAQKATDTKHEWFEDQIKGRGFTVTTGTASLATVSEADRAKLKVGTLFTIDGDVAVFRVTELASSTTFKFEVKRGNGSTKTYPATGDKCNIMATPTREGSSNGDGESTHRSTGDNYNYTQIFRKEIIVTGSALANATLDKVDNNVARQTEFALGEVSRDLNRCALFGVRQQVSAASPGTLGGLYEFGDGGLEVDGGGETFNSKLVNDGSQKITAEGGNPTHVLCSTGQARVLSNEFKKNLQIIREDKSRGAFVAVIINEVNGKGMMILADPDMPDSEAWVVDDACFARSDYRPLTDRDATEPGFDGIKRVALGELTLEFRNAKQRCCRIKKLKASETALQELAAAETKVEIKASSVTVNQADAE